MKIKLTLELAKRFSEMLEDNEEHMGEHAAHSVTCEQLGIDEMDGYDLLYMLSQKHEG